MLEAAVAGDHLVLHLLAVREIKERAKAKTKTRARLGRRKPLRGRLLHVEITVSFARPV